MTSKYKRLCLRLHLELSAFKVVCSHQWLLGPHLTSALIEGEQSSPTWPPWTPYSETAFAGMQSLLSFELWCWRRLWTARRSNQSILKEINPEYALEELMLKLKLQYFGHLMGRANSLEKTLMLGKTEGKRRRGWQRMKWLESITNTKDMNLTKLQEIVKDRGA